MSVARPTHYLASTVIQAAAATVTLPLLARILDKTEFGLASLSIAVAATASGLLDLGLAGWVTRSYFLPRGRPDDVVSTALVVNQAMAIGYCLAIGFAAVFTSAPLGVVMLGLVVSTTTSLMAQLLATHRGKGQSFAYLRLTATFATATQSFGLAGATWTGTAVGYAIGAALGGGVAVAIGFTDARVRLALPADPKVAKAALVAALPSVPHVLCVALVATAPRFVLAADSPTKVGQYQVAVLAGSAISAAINGLNNFWAPQAYGARDPGSYLARSTLFMSDFAMMLSGAAIFSAPLILPLLFGDAATLGVIRLCILLCLLPLLSVAYLAGLHSLYVSEMTKPLAVGAPLAALCSLMLSLALVPGLGVTGAAIANLGGLVCLGAYFQSTSRRHLRVTWDVRRVGIRMVVAVALTSCGLAASSGPAWLLASASLATLVIGGHKLRSSRDRLSNAAPAALSTSARVA